MGAAGKMIPKGTSAKTKAKSNKRKKWGSKKVKEKAMNNVYFTEETYQRMLKEVPSYKLITPGIISDRLKITVTLAKRGIEDLLSKKLIKPIVVHHKQLVYTRIVVASKDSSRKKSKK